MAHPRAGQPAEPPTSSTCPGWSPPTTPSTRTRTTRRSRSPSARPGTGDRACATPSTRTTSSPSPRRSATTGAEQGVDGPLFLARDTHALSEPADGRARWRCSPPTASPCWSTAGTATPRPRRCRTRSSPTTGAAPAGLADGIVITPSHNPPDGRRLQVQPDQRRARRQRRHQVDPGPGQRADRAPGSPEVRRIPYARARAADTTGTYDFLAGYVDDLPAVLDIDAIRSAGRAHRRRPAGRGQRRLLG